MKNLTISQQDDIAHTRDFLSSLAIILVGLSRHCEEESDKELANALFHLHNGCFEYQKKLECIISKNTTTMQI